MGHRDSIPEAAVGARRALLDAAVVLGAYLDAPQGEVDDELVVRALSAFMDARTRYLASLAAQFGATRDTGPPSPGSYDTVSDLVRRLDPS
jgi:hypothetical protein